MNTPPLSPSPRKPKRDTESDPAQPEPSTDTDSDTAGSPNELPSQGGPGPDTTSPSSAGGALGTLGVEVDEVHLDAEHDQEYASSQSSSSGDVEIYLSDLGLSGPVGSGASGRVFGIRVDEPAIADAPLLTGVQSFTRSPWSRQTSTASVQEATSHLSGPPLLTPSSHLHTRTPPLSSNTPTVIDGETTSSKTSTSDSTIDAGPTTTTTAIETNTDPSPSPTTSALHPNPQLESIELRTQLLSPVGDLVDPPAIPPATRMSTIPLPDMYDHDDPTTFLPRSLEQMDIREAQDALKRSPQDKARMKGLTVSGGSVLHPPAPPASPLPGLSGVGIPATAPPNMASFPPTISGYGQQHSTELNASSVGRSGSIPPTPTIGVMQQPTASYTQSQPLPQLPTFAPALSVINEGGPAMSKDDSHLTIGGEKNSEYATYGESEEIQANRAEVNPQPQRQNPNATILPVYQYGTITVSNSVVSFPNQPMTTTSTASMSHGLATASNGSGGRSGSEEGSAAGLSRQSDKTPNVYINGLPPHFPEEQLHALTAPFGEVKSVRTFTRHVRDSESGYGFVLFDTVEAAERCIIALRRYRNLHPTFSKQIHKIPGTIYAQPPTSPHGEYSDEASSSTHPWDGSSNGGTDDAEESFKARMESLADPTSTNLYMEGLPLSMDEPTLSALVSPHRVVSSRFFQTRLSNPPRIIAFVRLETRPGAEEVIERLHGRMVRGWNDTGSRISVRFADTSEQRELRRTERTTKEGGVGGEQSPSRLTIAQAALLNLRGQDLRPASSGSGSPLTASLPSVTSPLAMKPTSVMGSASRGGLEWSGREASAATLSSGVPGREIIGASRDYAGNASMGGGGGHGLALGASATPGAGTGRTVRLGNGAAGIDYGSAFAGSPIGTIGSLSREQQQQNQQYQRQYQSMDGMGDGMSGMGINVGGGAVQSPSFQADYSGRHDPGHQMQGRDGMMDPTMQALLGSLGGGGIDQQQQREYHRMQLERVSAYRHQQQPNVSQLLQYPGNYSGSGVASTHTGYTPAEEYIMRVHAESAVREREYDVEDQNRTVALFQQQQSAAAAAAAQRKRPTPLDLGRQGGGGMRRQDENGADIAMGVRGYRTHASLVGMSDEEVFHAQGLTRGDERDAEQHHQLDDQHYQQQQGGHHVHTRATTLPYQLQQQQGQGHRSSMGIAPQGASSATVRGPTGRGQGQTRHYQHNSMSVSSTTALRTPQHASSATMGGNSNSSVDQQQQQQQASNVQHQNRTSVGGDIAAKPTPNYRVVYSQQQQQQQQQTRDVSSQGYDDLSLSPTSSADSPSLISPALTYSSQTHTPSTLSPATPFFGSFGSQGDTFRGVAVVESGGVETGAKGGGGHVSLKTRLV